MLSLKIKGRRYIIRSRGPLLLACAALVAGLFIGEAAVRMFVKVPLGKEYMRFAVFGYRPIPASLMDKERLWKNSEEFRGCSYTKKKTAGVIRIACMGGSTTEGTINYMTREETYPYFLEQQVKKIFPDKKVEVMNCGVFGYSSFQVMRYLNEDVLSFYPDIVIVWVGVNDDGSAWAYADKDQKIIEEESSKGVLNKSRLFLFLRNFPQIMKIMHSGLMRVSAPDSAANIRQIAECSRRYNARAVFIIPFLLNKERNKAYYALEGDYADRFTATLKEEQCPVIDLVPWLNSQRDLKDLFFDTCHPSEKGTERIAGYLAQKLLKLGVLKSK